MNYNSIQEYLATTTNPVQLVKHMDEVPESKINYPLIAQQKYDGIYVLTIVTPSTIHFYSRTGKELFSELGNILPNYTWLPTGVYIGELVNENLTLEELAGLVSSNRKKSWDSDESYEMEASYIMFHDYLSLEDFVVGYSPVAYSERYKRLSENLRLGGLRDFLILGNVVNNREEADAHADLGISLGEEGSVFKQPDLGWDAGHKGHRAMKIVRGLHVDLLCVGVEYGKGKRTGQIAKLKFSYKGNVFSADLGKGWTDARRDALTVAHECPNLENNPNYIGGEATPIGKIWELKALQESSTGKALRLPKVVRVREDKVTPDA